MTGQDWLEKDYYAVLGVPRDADDVAIKKAYRKLARTHHPDANPGDPTAEQRFKDIGEAYAVLSDTEQRQRYDAIRAMGSGARFTAGGASAGGPEGFEDLLGNLFGGGTGRSQRVRFTTSGRGGPGAGAYDDLLQDILRNAGTAGGSPGGAPGGRGRDVEAAVRIPLRQALRGTQVRLGVNERGGQRPVTARIPPGIKDGQKVRLRGQGIAGPGGAGDVIVTVTVEPDPVFTWDGTALRLSVPITFAEASLGADVEIPTLDGTAKLRVPAGTPSGRTFRLRGRGPAVKGSSSDLLATVQVVVPQRLEPEARDAVETLRRLEADVDPRAALRDAARQEAGKASA